jgi:1-deoxy-D-xylulose-5-phosphate synthase
VYDIGYARCIPNTMLMAPKDEDELVDMLWTALQHKGPIFIRYPRGGGEGVKIKEHPAVLPIGKAEVLEHGTDVAVIFYGAVQSIVKKTVEGLRAEGKSVAIINARFAKPIDREMLEKYAHICKCICTIEDHVMMGGFGTAVVEALEDMHIRTPVARVGYIDSFMEHASSNDVLRDKYGLNAKVALAKVKECLELGARPEQRFKVVSA